MKLVPPDIVLLGGAVDLSSDVRYDFCMCNPPFFKNEEDKKGAQSRTIRRPIPTTQNTGNESETITPGGEVEFVNHIIEDSLKLKEKIRSG